MNLIADIFNGSAMTNDESLREIRINSFPIELLAHASVAVEFQIQTNRFVYIRIRLSMSHDLSTTSVTPRSSSQLMTAVCGSRASLSRCSMLMLSILL